MITVRNLYNSVSYIYGFLKLSSCLFLSRYLVHQIYNMLIEQLPGDQPENSTAMTALLTLRINRNHICLVLLLNLSYFQRKNKLLDFIKLD